jgi:hypothetical protein
MNSFSYFLQSAFPAVWIVTAAVGATVRSRNVVGTQEKIAVWQRWWSIAALGGGSLWMVVAFLGAPDVMATAIGFTRTPFMFEIAFANLALAVLAFRAASAPARELMTIGLSSAAFLWGAVIGHLYQWFANGDHAPGNTGGVLVYDILAPAGLIVLAVMSTRTRSAAGLPA